MQTDDIPYTKTFYGCSELNLNDPPAFADNQGSHVAIGFLAARSQDPRRYAPAVPLWHKNWLSTTPLTATIYQLSSQMRPHRILDIGCGNKPFRSVFSETSFYWGIDIVEGSSSSADIVGDVCVLPFASGIFDTVLCFQVMEHLAKPAEMLAEAFRVLEPGGEMLLSAPMTWRHHEEPYDFFRYTRYGLRYLLESAGFQILSICHAGGVWRVVGQNLASAIDSAIRMSALRPAKVSLTALVNILFAFLDRVNPNDENTCNFAVLARKAN